MGINSISYSGLADCDSPCQEVNCAIQSCNVNLGCFGMFYTWQPGISPPYSYALWGFEAEFSGAANGTCNQCDRWNDTFIMDFAQAVAIGGAPCTLTAGLNVHRFIACNEFQNITFNIRFNYAADSYPLYIRLYPRHDVYYELTGEEAEDAMASLCVPEDVVLPLVQDSTYCDWPSTAIIRALPP